MYPNTWYFVIDSQVCQKFDQIIIHIIRENKSISMFLINRSNCFTGTYLKLLQHLR